MFCVVKLSGNLEVGTVVQYDTTENKWTTASSHQDTIGVVSMKKTKNGGTDKIYML